MFETYLLFISYEKNHNFWYMFHLYLAIFSLTENIKKYFQLENQEVWKVQKQRITNVRYLIWDIFTVGLKMSQINKRSN